MRFDKFLNSFQKISYRLLLGVMYICGIYFINFFFRFQKKNKT